MDLGILNSQGIQQHICDILEGGERAFELRKISITFDTFLIFINCIIVATIWQQKIL